MLASAVWYNETPDVIYHVDVPNIVHSGLLLVISKIILINGKDAKFNSRYQKSELEENDCFA